MADTHRRALRIISIVIAIVTILSMVAFLVVPFL